MATPITYVNFNTDKTIDELLYNTDQYKYRFKTLEAELKFYKFLIEANIFKPKVINLFERLTTFDKKIGAYSNQIEALHLELTTHKKEIKNKIECDNLECDAFFIEKHTSIELQITSFIFRNK